MMNKIKRIFRNIAVPGLMNYLVFAMGLMYVADLLTQGKLWGLFAFSRSAILTGQVWRVLTFTILPINTSPIWTIIALLLYFQIGRELESSWGTHEVTCYLLLSWALTVVTGFIFGYVGNYNIYLGLFLAYGKVLPHMQMRLFFMIPVEAWILALVDAVLMALSLIMYGEVSAIPAFITFAIFFGGEYITMIKSRKRMHDFKEAFKHRNDDK